MHLEITYPNYMIVAGYPYQVGETEVRVELEPDDWSWYIARIFIEARLNGTYQMVQVPTRDTMFAMIKTWALQEYRPQLEDLWSEYLADKPKRKRPLSDAQEHSTQWGQP
jgi:hypothetical protein